MSYFNIFEDLTPNRYLLHKFLTEQELFSKLDYVDVILIGFCSLSLEVAFFLGLNNYSALVVDNGFRDFVPRFFLREHLPYKSIFLRQAGCYFEQGDGLRLSEIFIEQPQLVYDLELLARDEGSNILKNTAISEFDSKERLLKLRLKRGNDYKWARCKVALAFSPLDFLPEQLFSFVWATKQSPLLSDEPAKISPSEFSLDILNQRITFSSWQKRTDCRKYVIFKRVSAHAFYLHKKFLIPRVDDAKRIFMGVLSFLTVAQDISYLFPKWLPLSKILLDKRASDTQRQLLKLMGEDVSKYES